MTMNPLNITDEESAYMEYLDDIYGVEGYGLLMFKGDPIQFQVGFEEYQAEGRSDE